MKYLLFPDQNGPLFLHLLSQLTFDPHWKLNIWTFSKERTESWEQLLFNCCFSVFQKNPLPSARLNTTGHSAVLQCLPRAKMLPPGPRRTARSLNWQETGSICTVMHEAPVTDQHGGKSDIMINTFRRRYIGVHDVQNPFLKQQNKQQHRLSLPPVTTLKVLISGSASFTCGGFIAVF